MRRSYNPNKDKEINRTKFIHQVVIPVYIPNKGEYFDDVFKIFRICISSLFITSHSKTYFTVVDNGSCTNVRKYLEELLASNLIHELITVSNIGKYNSIVKAIAGHDIDLITVTDADILFLNGWQKETTKVFNAIPKTGVVGLIPQFLIYQNESENVLLDFFFSDRMKFTHLKNPEALRSFYKSIGWKEEYPEARLKYQLSLKGSDNCMAYVGSGHAVATYRRELFLQNFPLYNKFRMGGGSEQILDRLAIRNGYYRLTTENNYAYHMGNSWEPWMDKELDELKPEDAILDLVRSSPPRKPKKLAWKLKKKVVNFLLKRHRLRMQFLKYKGLPSDVTKSF